jgi:hypothetical protein
MPADRLSGLHEQGFVSFQFAQRLHDAVERFPVTRGTADAAVNDKLISVARPLPDRGCSSACAMAPDAHAALPVWNRAPDPMEFSLP